MTGHNYQQGYDDEPEADGPIREGSSDPHVYSSGPALDERTPLISAKSQTRVNLRLIVYGIIALALSSLVLVNLGLHVAYCPLWPSTRNAIRREWEDQVTQHDLWQEEWRYEERNHTATLGKWALEREWHEQEVARRIRVEKERQERERRNWIDEEAQHRLEWDDMEKRIVRRILEEEERQERVRKQWENEVEEYEKEVARRVRDEEARQERERGKWVEEEAQHRLEWEEKARQENQRQENERKKWKREVDNHDQIEEERRRHEEEERQKLNMFWGQVKPHTCVTYATREYTAQLMNLPATWEHPVEACKATPLVVHGMSYIPRDCEDKGYGVVIGRWEIGENEPDCSSFWNWYKDKGCTSPGSGKRRIEHYLENLPHGSDWREFCATTPARFLGLEFSGAQECFQYNLGTYGHWEIDDAGCQ